MTEGSVESLAAWFRKRPRWLQLAASRWCSGAAFDEALLNALEETCIDEAAGSSADPWSPLTDEQIYSSARVSELRLLSLSEPQGINALAPRKPLVFGEHKLVIVYGQNGSGKSGYTRILKHMCGAPKKGALHANVFLEKSLARGCKVTFRRDGLEETEQWQVGGEAISALRGTLIFDSHAAEAYIDEECEVSYEPRVLCLFSDLARACGAVSAGINRRIQALPSTLPELPVKCHGTKSGAWYQALTSTTPDSDVAAWCKWDETDGAELMRAKQGLADPERDVGMAKQQMTRLQELLTAAAGHRTALEEPVLEELERLRCARDVSARAATMAARAELASAKLRGVGEGAWFVLWEAAREYSEGIAYPGKPFPNAEPEARCTLCHQELGPEGAERLQNFEQFVRGKLVRSAGNARAALEKAAEKLKAAPEDNILCTQLAAAGVNDTATQHAWLTLYQTLRQRRDRALSEEPLGQTDDRLPSFEEIEAILQGRFLALSATAASSGPQTVDDCSDLKVRIAELEARCWITDQRMAVEREILRLRRIALLESARHSASTTTLSRRKGDIAEELVSNAFRERFQSELVRLKGRRLRVKLEKTRVDRGRALHQLKVDAQNVLPPAEVLSEGERRVISLAAFLADAAGSPGVTPFIFDDPISSLDQDYEEAVVERLVDLAHERQLIVFTHRLSLLVLLQEAAKRRRLEVGTVCLRNEPWGAGEPADMPLDGKNPIGALKKLRDERLANAGKVYCAAGTDDYAPLAKSICSDLRIVLERIVEVDLLSGVVERFRRSIMTKDKLQRLAAISDEDVHLIDRMMTKYSIYEHSQPLDAPVQPLTPEEIKGDMDTLIAWHAAFTKRLSISPPSRSVQADGSIPPSSGKVARSATRAPQRDLENEADGSPTLFPQPLTRKG